MTPVDYACGQCTGCRLEKSRQWAVRCVHEAQMHERNCFLTLTYKDKHLPKDRSLDIRHWQKFARDLRYSHGAFRYYHCGEYGEDTHRLHLHALVFGLDFFEDREHVATEKGYRLFESPTLNKTWGRGAVKIGELNQRTAAYCARYTMKKQGGAKGRLYYRALALALTGDPNYERIDLKTGEVFDGLKPPYSTMSRRPGIGANWIKKYKTDVYPCDFVIDSNFQKSRPPSFYDNQLPEDELDDLKAKRVIQARPSAFDRTPDRLRDREACKESQTKTLKRAL